MADLVTIVGVIVIATQLFQYLQAQLPESLVGDAIDHLCDPDSAGWPRAVPMLVAHAKRAIERLTELAVAHDLGSGGDTVRNRVVTALCRIAQEARDREQRIRAITVLSGNPSEPALDALLRALSDELPVAAQAVLLLGASTASHKLEGLEALLTSGDTRERIYGVLALGVRANSCEACMPVLQRACDNESSDVRAIAERVISGAHERPVASPSSPEVVFDLVREAALPPFIVSALDGLEMAELSAEARAIVRSVVRAATSEGGVPEGTGRSGAK